MNQLASYCPRFELTSLYSLQAQSVIVTQLNNKAAGGPGVHTAPLYGACLHREYVLVRGRLLAGQRNREGVREVEVRVRTRVAG